MSRLDEEIIRGLADLENSMADRNDDGVELPPQVTIGGRVWPCVRGVKDQGKAQVEGGYVFVYDYAVHIRKDAIANDGITLFSSITVLPEDLITDQGDSMRVVKVSNAQGSHVTLHLVDPNRQ